MSVSPCVIKNGFACVHGSYEERKLFREQADRDWKNFLLSRGMELKSCGYMVVIVCVTETQNHGRSFFACLSEAWKQLYKKDKIKSEEFKQATLGLYTERTEFELRSAFEDPENRKTGLKFVSIRDSIHHLRPLINLYQKSDKQAAANALVDFVRPWLRNVLYRGLLDSRPQEEKEVILDEYFTVLLRMALEDKLKIDYILNKEVIAKKMSSPRTSPTNNCCKYEINCADRFRKSRKNKE